MRVLLTLLRKEIKQIFRNRMMLPMIFVMPIVQLTVLVYTANLEMSNIEVVVVDQDLSQYSRGLVSKLDGSPFFVVKGSVASYEQAEALLLSDDVDAIVQIYSGFEQNLINEKEADVQLIINAINATEGSLINVYSNMIIRDYSNNLRTELSGFAGQGMALNIEIIPSYWYNPLLDYKIYMFAGILVILVTMIGMFLSALNLVSEKELGTAEQINVTPVKKYQFLLAKLLPFLMIGLFELAFGLLIGVFLVDLPIRGSLLLLFSVAFVYLLVTLGLGLFLSTISSTQQQMMLVAFFIWVTFILMSGIFTPTESMPVWAQKINFINPLSYFMRVIRMILLKGSGFQDIARDFYGLLIYSVLILSLAIGNYRKTT